MYIYKIHTRRGRDENAHGVTHTNTHQTHTHTLTHTGLTLLSVIRTRNDDHDVNDSNDKHSLNGNCTFKIHDVGRVE